MIWFYGITSSKWVDQRPAGICWSESLTWPERPLQKVNQEEHCIGSLVLGKLFLTISGLLGFSSCKMQVGQWLVGSLATTFVIQWRPLFADIQNNCTKCSNVFLLLSVTRIKQAAPRTLALISPFWAGVGQGGGVLACFWDVLNYCQKWFYKAQLEQTQLILYSRH